MGTPAGRDIRALAGALGPPHLLTDVPGCDETAPLPGRAATADDGPDGPRLTGGSLFGRYLIVDRVGAGGVGEVYAAYDPNLDRRIALKVLRDEHSPSGTDPSSKSKERAATRLIREAKALANLSHPNVVTVHDVGQLEGRTFIAMELVEGSDLSDWLEAHGNEAGWSKVLALVLAAGRGLAAAHAKGMVHRDFKPANVLIGRDDWVRVTDFGLARLLAPIGPAADLDTSSTASTELDATLSTQTAHGRMVGTPYYMAPEQHEGIATVRSDIYAYCLSAHEALFGERPFPLSSLPALVTAKLDGPPAAPVSARAIPLRIRRAIERGLEPDPERRWASMEALLAELETTGGRRRLLLPAAIGTTVAVGFLVAASGNDATCTGAPQHLVGAWDDDRKAALADAFGASDFALADDAHDRVVPALDGYATTWADTHRQACEATQRGEQSAELMDHEMICLRRHLAELRATVDVLAEGSATAIERSVSAVSALPDPGACLDAVRPQDLGRGPETEVEIAVRDELARIDALTRTGLYAEAFEATEALTERLRTMDSGEQLAESLYRHGNLHDKLGRVEAAEATLEDAVWTAQAAGFGDGQIQSASLLAYVVGNRASRRSEGLRWSRYAWAQCERDGAPAAARATVLTNESSIHDRAGDPERALAILDEALALIDAAGIDDVDRRAGLIDNMGSSLRQAGRFDEAIARHEEALKLREGFLGPDHPLLARTLTNLATALASAARYDEAEAMQRRALAIREKVLGPNHLDVAITLNNLAANLYQRGRMDEAEQLFRRVLAIRQAALPPDHPKVAGTFSNLGLLLETRGAYQEASEHYEKALALLEGRTDPDRLSIANVLGNLGNLRAAQQRHDDAAALYERALAIEEEMRGPEHPVVAMQLSNLGNMREEQGRYAEAQAVHARALAIREKTQGPDHPDLMYTLGGLGGAYMAAGDPDAAIPYFERALAIGAKGDAPPTTIGASEFELAQALWDSGGDRPKALQLARSARERFADHGRGREDTLAQIDDWLDEHGRSPRRE